MEIPLTIADHMRRASLVYGDRIGIIDEPDQPAPSMGEITYRRFEELATGLAAGLDELGLPLGARVGIVSQNAARVLIHLYGTSAFGRVAVPINFRLSRDEVDYIVRHSGADALIIDPELESTLGDIPVKHRFIAGEESDSLYKLDTEPMPWEPAETATATINYTSAPRPAPRAWRCRIATCGSTRRLLDGTPASMIATSTSTPSRCFTATDGECPTP